MSRGQIDVNIVLDCSEDVGAWIIGDCYRGGPGEEGDEADEART